MVRTMMGCGMMDGGMVNMMSGMGYGGMMGPIGWWASSLFGTLLALGLVLLVWLAVIKLWRDVFGKKK